MIGVVGPTDTVNTGSVVTDARSGNLHSRIESYLSDRVPEDRRESEKRGVCAQSLPESPSELSFGVRRGEAERRGEKWGRN